MAVYEGIEYLNSGDWVESLSALVQDEEGNWNIFRYEDVLVTESKKTELDSTIRPAS